MIAFLAVKLRIKTEGIRHLPVEVQAVVEAGAVNVVGMNASLRTANARVADGLVAAQELVLDAADDRKLEVAAVKLVLRSIVELLAENKTCAVRVLRPAR